MEESPQQQEARPKKGRSRRSRLTKERSEKEVRAPAPKESALVAPKPVDIANKDASRITNETSVDITQYDCELDNDTTALMARLEKIYHKSKPVAVTPPANENDDGARLAQWEENEEAEENTTDEEVETRTNKRSLQSQLSKRSLQQDTLSQAPSVISEQYLESVEDLPFDDDSFVPLMVISPIQNHRQVSSVHCGVESRTPSSMVQRNSSSRQMQDIQENESDESYPPPVSEIELSMTDNTDMNVAGYQSEKLSQFLKASGQDDEVAAATARAFEAFLLSQEQAMLQLIPEEDLCDTDDDPSFPQDYQEHVGHERARPTSDVDMYAKLAAVQMGTNQVQLRQSMGGSRRSLGHNQVHASRHSRRGHYASGKENHQSYRGIPRQASNHRPFYESHQAMVNESFANQSSIGPCEDHEDSFVAHQHPPAARLGRHESLRSVRSERRNLAPDFDHFGRIRQNDMVASVEPSRQQKVDQYNEIRHSSRVMQASISSDMASYTRGVSSLQINGYNTLEKPQCVDSGSSTTWSTPPASVRSAERTLAEQIESLPIAHRACYNALKSKWELRSGGKKAFPDELYLRFAMCSSPMPFDFKSAWTVMKRFDRRYLNLSITSMHKQLLTRVSMMMLCYLLMS